MEDDFEDYEEDFEDADDDTNADQPEPGAQDNEEDEGADDQDRQVSPALSSNALPGPTHLTAVDNHIQVNSRGGVRVHAAVSLADAKSDAVWGLIGQDLDGSWSAFKRLLFWFGRLPGRCARKTCVFNRFENKKNSRKSM